MTKKLNCCASLRRSRPSELKNGQGRYMYSDTLYMQRLGISIPDLRFGSSPPSWYAARTGTKERITWVGLNKKCSSPKFVSSSCVCFWWILERCSQACSGVYLHAYGVHILCMALFSCVRGSFTINVCRTFRFSDFLPVPSQLPISVLPKWKFPAIFANLKTSPHTRPQR